MTPATMTGDEADREAARWNRLFPVGTRVRVDGCAVGVTTGKACVESLGPDQGDVFGDAPFVVLLLVDGRRVNLCRVVPVELP